MKYLSKVLLSLLACIMMILLMSCGEEDTEPPKATVNPVEGTTIKSGDIITVKFSEEVEPASVTATVSAGKATVTTDSTSTTIKLTDLPSGEEVLLVINARDMAGNAMTAKIVKYKTVLLPPTDGTWNGTTDQGSKISFVVADDGHSIRSLTIEFEVRGTYCSATVETTVSSSGTQPLADIIDNQFSVSISGQTSGSTSGTFTSPTEGKGTYYFYDSYCRGSVSGTWNASL